MINDVMKNRLVNNQRNGAPQPRYGAEIFSGTDYPQTWDGFIGQEQAKSQLTTAIMSARVRRARLDHVLLASGLHGIGKTTLAQIVGNTLHQTSGGSSGYVAVSGALTVDEARTILLSMNDYDVLFWDEFHLAVAGNKNRADWLLPYLTDHSLLTKAGTEVMPDVTVIAATTDVGKLPQTVLSRFMLRPLLVEYTPAEANMLVENLASRMKVEGLTHNDRVKIATAANRNPREMRVILTAVRDLYTANGYIDLPTALMWVGVTADGLSREAQDMMLVLLAAKDHTASIESIGAALGEPGPMRYHEQALLRRGYVSITGRGRVLTEDGLTRARGLLEEMRNA